MRAHYWIGLVAVVVGGVHGLGMIQEDNGWMYWAGWGGMVLMTITGALLLWKRRSMEPKQQQGLFHIHLQSLDNR